MCVWGRGLLLIKTYLSSMGQERLNGLTLLSIERANHALPLLCLKGVVRQVYRTVLSQLVGLDVQILRQNELYRIVSSHDQIET